jgi:transposase-like protein
MKEFKSKYGRRFSEEFQRDAVRMLENGERTVKELSQELGVSEWSLKRWAKIYVQNQENQAPEEQKRLEAENAKLRRELETVSRQRDILKKALGILGQEPSNSTK